MGNERFSRRLDRRQMLGGVLAAGSVAGLAWQASPLVAAAAAAASGASLGLNLATVRYYTSERPFQNLADTISTPVSNRVGGSWGDGEPLEFDERGWLKSVPNGHEAALVLDLRPGHANTLYRVTYEGPRDAVRVDNSKDLTFRKSQPNKRVLIYVKAPITSLRIVEAGSEGKEVFAAPFLERCRRFSTLRFMDWGLTNEDREMDWSRRVTPGLFTQADREVALEHMVDLCLAADCGLWYCVHHQASDDYVREVARLLKARWKSSRPIYVEHSNEVWNGGFPQHHHCQAQSNDWLEYHVQRTGQIAELVRGEGLDITAVLGLQSAAYGRDRRLLDMKVPGSINATAIAPYFGGRLGSKRELASEIRDGGVERVLEECRKSLDELPAEIRGHRELADKLGMKLLAYEGGQHLAGVGPLMNDVKLVDLFALANRAPGMYDLYRDYLKLWNEESGGGLMCLYHSVGEYTKFGSWGLMEYDGQDPARAPKYRAVIDHLDATPRA